MDGVRSRAVCVSGKDFHSPRMMVCVAASFSAALNVTTIPDFQC